MSENVEFIERAIAAFNARDLDTLAEICHDDFEFHSVLAAVDADEATYRGPDSWVRYFAVMDEMWDEWRVAEPRITDAGDNRLVCLLRLAGRGSLSGVPVDRPIGMTYELRDGQVWRMQAYREQAEALRAVGLGGEVE